MKAEHDQNGLPIQWDISFHAEIRPAPTSPCVAARPARDGHPGGRNLAVPDHHGSSVHPLSAASHGCSLAMLAAQAAFSWGHRCSWSQFLQHWICTAVGALHQMGLEQQQLQGWSHLSQLEVSGSAQGLSGTLVTHLAIIFLRSEQVLKVVK